MNSYIFRVKTLAVLCSIALTGCATLNADLKTGKEARRAGDYETAVQNLQPLADFGMPEAQYELALLELDRKDATPEELAKARGLLKSLADKGNAEANFELGRQHEQFEQLVEARQYYTRAAELGYMRALFQLGAMSEKEKNYSEAEGLYKRAYEGQYYRAAERIGRLYEKGSGRPVNLKAALSWYRIAQQGGVSNLETKIATLEAGIGSQ